jgi:hypothetical protein
VSIFGEHIPGAKAAAAGLSAVLRIAERAFEPAATLCESLRHPLPSSKQAGERAGSINYLFSFVISK